MPVKIQICLVISIILSFNRPICMQHLECLNPQRFRGVCIPIQQCNYLLNIARYSQQNREAYNFLRQSQCGFNGQIIYGCCPSTQLAPQPKVNQFQSQTQSQLQTQPQGKNFVAPTNMAVKPELPRPPVCGNDAENRVIGGTKTEISEYPWLALLKYSRPGTTTPSFACAGTLISDRYVVTAAHCIHPTLVRTNRLTAVRLGEWNLSTNPDCDDSFINEKVCANSYIDVGVEGTVIHENYLPQSFNQHNDIALLRLSLKIVFTEFIKPICTTGSSASLIGQSVMVTGFGKTESALTSNIKLKAALDVVENDKCSQIFRAEGRRLFDGQLCAGGKKGIDSCRGDSGGPIMQLVTQNRVAFWTLVGIVSYGSSPCGVENRPAVYTKLSSFIPWIESKIKN